MSCMGAMLSVAWSTSVALHDTWPHWGQYIGLYIDTWLSADVWGGQ